MQEDGNIGLDCSLFSILVAFRASSNPSTFAPGCQVENLKPREVDTKPKWLERFFSTKE